MPDSNPGPEVILVGHRCLHDDVCDLCARLFLPHEKPVSAHFYFPHEAPVIPPGPQRSGAPDLHELARAKPPRNPPVIFPAVQRADAPTGPPIVLPDATPVDEDRPEWADRVEQAMQPRPPPPPEFATDMWIAWKLRVIKQPVANVIEEAKKMEEEKEQQEKRTVCLGEMD